LIKRYFLEDNNTARKILVGKTAVGKKGRWRGSPGALFNCGNVFKTFWRKGGKGGNLVGGGGENFYSIHFVKKMFSKNIPM
jgi:hypothetical protein